jgi:hypothetical protein
MMYKNNFVVVIKCDGKILRELGGEVYLPYNSEYSIMLKNKDARRASVSIEVDGQDALNGNTLIIDANTHNEIHGFMRNMNETNKFKFINKTKEIQNHRGDKIDDGLVRITYQFEEPVKPVVLSTPGTYNPYVPWSDGKGFNWQDNNITYNDSRGPVVSFACCSNSGPQPDEGITVKGDKIDQHYSYGSIGQLDPEINTIVLHLKGALLSTTKLLKKPLTVKTKITCSTCGRKNKSNNKFCYNCGTYLH